MLHSITTKRDLQNAISTLEKADMLALDLETTGLNPRTDRIVIVAIATETDTFTIDCFTLEPAYVCKALKPLLESGKLIIGHNITFDVQFLFKHDIEIPRLHCTMIIENVLNAGKVIDARADLKSVASRYIPGLVLNKKVRLEFTQENLVLEPYHFEYAGNDVTYLFTIYEKQMEKVRKWNLERVYELEMGIINVTALMEYTGIGIDAERLRSYIPYFENYIKRADQAMQDLFIRNGACDEVLFTAEGWTGINLQSKPQCIAALNRVGVDVKTLNAKDVLKWDLKHSRNVDTVEYRITLDEDVNDALEHYEGLSNPYLRALAFTTAARKLLSAYVEGTLRKIDPSTGRVHGWFKQVGAKETGRYSSDLQQIPNDIKLKRLSIPYSIRGCLQPAKGRVFVSADYSAIELVILADLSGDDRLGHEVINGDVHLVVVKEALASLTPLALEITNENKGKEPFKSLRQAAKRVSYATAYGVTGASLSEQLAIDLGSLNIKVSKEQADKILLDWKTKAFPQAGMFLKESANQAVTRGWTESALGRKRWYDLDYAKDNKWKLFAYMRQGSNQRIQSSSSDLTKKALLYAYRRLDKKKGRIVLTVHDEIVIECLKSYVDEAKRILKESMELPALELFPRMGKYIIVDVNVSDCYDK